MKSHQFIIDYASSPWADPNNPLGTNRFSWRTELILSRNQESIKGKNVLDLACNTGRLSFPCLELGAKSVTGVEARDELIEMGRELMAKTPHADKMTFVQSDLFKYLENLNPGQFDTILCFGYLYHTVRQVDFFRLISQIRPQYLLIDTSVSRNYWWFGRKNFGQPPALFLSHENFEETRNTTDVDGTVFWPTPSFLEEMMRRIGYRFSSIDFKGAGITNWAGMEDYRRGQRVAYFACDAQR